MTYPIAPTTSIFDEPVDTIKDCQKKLFDQYIGLKYDSSNSLIRDGRLMEVRGLAHQLIEASNTLIALTSK